MLILNRQNIKKPIEVKMTNLNKQIFKFKEDKSVWTTVSNANVDLSTYNIVWHYTETPVDNRASSNYFC